MISALVTSSDWRGLWPLHSVFAKGLEEIHKITGQYTYRQLQLGSVHILLPRERRKSFQNCLLFLSPIHSVEKVHQDTQQQLKK